MRPFPPPMRHLTRAAAALAAAATLAAAAPLAAAPPDAIRVGGPSDPGDPKVAVVGTAVSAAGAPFEVRDAANGVVLTGTLAAATGDPRPWAHLAVADLSGVTAPGAYRVAVPSLGLTSTAWRVDAAARGALMQRLLRFFRFNRDGHEPNPVFNPSHLNDAVVATGPLAGRRFDLTGGWRDAGDNVKFAASTGMAVTYLLLAARLDPANAAALRAEADVGVRWLVKLHPVRAPGLPTPPEAQSVFVAQVGDARDHNRVGQAEDPMDPVLDDSSQQPGIGQRFAYVSDGSDVAGWVSAALAHAAAAEPGRGPGGRRAMLVDLAEEWFAVGARTQAGDRTDFGSAGSAVELAPYDDPEWHDQMAMAAAALRRATGKAAYTKAALRLLAADAAKTESSLEGGQSWADTAALAAADLCGGLGRPAVGDPAFRAAACGPSPTAFLARAAERARADAARAAFGSVGKHTWGWVQDHAGAAVVAHAAQRAGVLPSGRAIAVGARDFLLGRNPWAASFVVGTGAGEAKSPHGLHTLRTPAAAVFDGLVVGGPIDPSNFPWFSFENPNDPHNGSLDASYEDHPDNYITSEGALTYSASAVLLLASLAS